MMMIETIVPPADWEPPTLPMFRDLLLPGIGYALRGHPDVEIDLNIANGEIVVRGHSLTGAKRSAMFTFTHAQLLGNQHKLLFLPGLARMIEFLEAPERVRAS